ncbi:hypothetical protein FOZ63_016884 [Perkinsus olseni]|uniref:Uncharacterized protein n=1 Tax=Perkinsus olseni TaxID=32597 RepID=A0A7J6U9H7_PEROL|nr:hypothetical protein FOZ63_016884 [Perkinsus olseni]
MSTAANCAPCFTEVSTLCIDATENGAFECYFDDDSRKLYVLYNNGGVLLQHDMASGKTEERISIPHLAACGGETAGIVVASGCLYVGKKYVDSRRGGTEIEFLCALVGSTEVRPVHTVYRQGQSYGPSFGCFALVPGHPQAVDALYQSGGTWHSVRMEVTRSANPMLFSTEGDELDGRYVLRHHRGYSKVATIAKAGETTFPEIFGRWTFSHFDETMGGLRILKCCHPYLM